LFGFANAGVALNVGSLHGAAMEIPLGIAAGLFLGKQIGVFSMTWAAIRLGWASMPEGASTRQIYGVSVLCGIGFTMSLFIGLLAFPGAPALQEGVKLGVLAGSVASAILGAGILLLRRSRAERIAAAGEPS
jgi:NhaA family Na+:H+ antiporter